MFSRTLVLIVLNDNKRHVKACSSIPHAINQWIILPPPPPQRSWCPINLSVCLSHVHISKTKQGTAMVVLNISVDSAFVWQAELTFIRRVISVIRISDITIYE